MSLYDAASEQLPQYAAAKATAPPTVLRTSQGAPVDSLTASMTAGAAGPIVLQDFTLLDHMAKFDRERIPERVVHAKGAGAFGYFQVTHAEPIQSICKAHMFQTLTEKTPVAVRFSTVGGESGSADTARDPRGFAVKFYTRDGNWDLVGNNTPIFFLRDPVLFPSFIHTQKRNPATHLACPNMFWDFISLRPETTHQVSFLFSDRGIPDGYRHMNGYGSHAFRNVNAAGNAVYVKYHFKTDQGIRNLTVEEAHEKKASDPDYAIRDLYNAIATGNFPSWTLYVQIMTLEQAASATFDPFDLTKIWSHKDYPLHPVGRLVLNRNPVNYFAEVEQLAFAPSHMVPGIEPSPDKMLQARLFSYPDTHRHRLGSNYHAIPVNCPWRVTADSSTNYQRDGPMQVSANGAGSPNYFPNSFGGPQPDPAGAAAFVETISPTTTGGATQAVGVQVQRVETGDADNFSQVRTFYMNVLDDDARDRLTSNIAHHLAGVTQPFLVQRVLSNLAQVHTDYSRRVQDKLKRIYQEQQREQQQEKAAAAPLNPPRVIPPKSAAATTEDDIVFDNEHQRAVCPFGFGRQPFAHAHGYSSKL